MSKNFVARATASIEAPKTKVWQALVAPDAIKQYLFGAEVESDWSEGSPIRWKSEINGQQYQDRGVILKIEPEQILQYSHFRPLSGKPDKFENYPSLPSICLAVATKPRYCFLRIITPMTRRAGNRRGIGERCLRV
ncbi:MAG: SRPBCC domain-containing protein [Candidatus Binatia bacterium]